MEVRQAVWDQMCEDYDRGLIDSEDLMRYAKILFTKEHQVAVDSVIRQLEACNV